MATEAVQPLKIIKNASPAKTSRPLAELGPTEQRRNSPSYNQSSRKMLLKHESSPFDSSPFQPRSPRTFWEDRATLSPPVKSENDPERSCSPEVSRRRSSIENLKRASRVKNSSMYAKETKHNYDPSSSPVIERPLNNRPWGGQLQSNVFARYDSIRKENNPITSPARPQNPKVDLDSDVPVVSPSKIPAPSPAPESTAETTASPRREIASPVRSSLAASSRYANSPPAFDPDNGTWSENEDDFRASTPRAQPRHAKSVTFQESPPEINRYEEQTPEPSSNASGSREGSFDSFDDDEEDYSFDGPESGENDEDSFDASLEDVEKTPVVLPGDWRHMSPENVNTDLVDDFDDVFDERGRGSPAPSAQPTKSQRPEAFRTDSGASDGSDFRPLPPIPGFASSPRRGREGSPRGLAMAAERASSLQRSLPSPPRAASVSKDEILRMREATMSLEDRMGLMALQESLAEVHRTQSGTGQGLAPAAEIDGREDEPPSHDDQVDQDDRDYLGDLADFDVAPSISRESILRNVKSNRFDDFTDNDYNEDESTYDSPERDYADLDPDVAIPSRETSTQFNEEDAAVIKQEEESFIDLDAIPAMHAFGDEQYERQSSVIRHQVPEHESELDQYDGEERYDDESHYDEESRYDDESRYSSPMSLGEELEQPEDQGTPRASVTPVPEEEAFSTPLEGTLNAEAKHMSLPLLGNFLGANDYGFGLESYMTPSPPPASEEKEERPSTAPEMHDLPTTSVLNPPEMFKPSDSVQEERPNTGTPESVSAYSDRDSFDSVIHGSLTEEMSPEEEEPVIPERRATIKTQGKLKARPSGTPADLQAMASQRRQVSIEVPPIPDKYRSTELDTNETQSIISEGTAEDGASDVEDSSESTEVDSLVDDKDSVKNRRQSRKQLKLDLDLPDTSLEASSGLGLMEEFDRVMESQKKGYLMRQNTKVVVASNRNFSDETARLQSPPTSPPMSPPMSPSAGSSASFRATRSAGNSPRKSSAGEKWLTAEPWNGKTRRKSTRKSSGRRSNVGTAPAPPLPGQESALGTVDEYMTTDDTDEGAERGRLFVKVVGVKDLDLPFPRNDRLYFQLTLDNGLHCVTTANLELGKSALIGQEFELVVLTDLEFQLTLTTKLPPAPKPQQIAAPPPVPSSPTKSVKSGSVFSRLLSSPKKRAERERKEREEAELVERRRREEVERSKRVAAVKPTPWDMMREVVDAKTGSFARAYVNLKSHETQCFGRPLTVDVPCFNEWALEKDANVVSSVRSKRNNGNLAFGRADGAVRRPPYTVGNLELQLLYVPKPKVANDDDMPKSMSSAIREMKAAEQVKEVFWEGCLSQQGGDCPYWRRRFFKLQGTKLTAYHEATMQPRATINLSKAAKLIDDRSALVADPNGGNPSSRTRRKSAFAEDDEGYQFVEDGFRIRFANGETIDFYADNVAQKDAWMKVLSQSVGKPAASKQAKWTDVVLSKERADTKLAGKGESDRKASAASAETNASSTKSARPKSAGAFREGASTPPMSPRTGHRSRDQVKSMIF